MRLVILLFVLMLLPSSALAVVTLTADTDEIFMSNNAGNSVPSVDGFKLIAQGTGSPVNFTITDNQPWLSVSPANGSISQGQERNITVTADSSVLEARNSDYVGVITIRSGNQTIIVTIFFRSNGVEITVAPNTIAVDLIPGGQTTRAINIVTSNDQDADLVITTSQSWLQVSSTQLEVPGGITLTIRTTGLSGGSYAGNVDFTCNPNSAPCVPKRLTVNLTVTPTFLLTSSPTTVNLAADRGSTTPAETTFTITATGTGSFPLTVTAEPVWLSFLQSATTISNGGSVTITARARADQLDPGTYTAIVNVQAGPAQLEVELNFTVRGSVLLILSSTPVRFEGIARGQAVPPQTVRMTVVAGQAANFQVTDNAPWLKVTPASPTNVIDLVLTLTVDSNALPAGTSNATITVACVGVTPCTPTTIPVIATTLPGLTTSLTSLTFVGTAGGSSPPAQTVQVNMSDSTSTGFAVTPATSNGGNWLQATSSSAVTPAVVTVTATVGSLPEGAYNGTVRLIPGSGGPEVVIAVTLQVTNSTRPSISSVGTAGGGSGISQNAWVEIKGTNLAPSSVPPAGTTWSAAPEFAQGRMPTSVEGVSVTINGQPAFVFFVSREQVNVLAPLDNTLGPVEVIVRHSNQVSAVFNATLQVASPTFPVYGAGGFLVATHLNGTVIGPATLAGVSPAAPGEMVVIYAFGFGLPKTMLTNGASSQFGELPELPAIQIGGVPALVTFAGVVGPGLYQLNVATPGGLSTGPHAVTGNYRGLTIAGTPVLSVQR